MDTLDIAIVRTMGIQPYGRAPRSLSSLAPRHIARALRVTPETVRNRVARMEAEGVISGYEVFPNLRHLGLRASCYLVRGDEEDGADFEGKLLPLDGLLEVQTFLGGGRA